jgi:two-component system response regulator YesN
VKLYKILIADDEYLERKALGIILEDKVQLNEIEIVGFAANGNEVVKMAREREPDIIFMDIKMLGLNGLNAIKMIKEYLYDVKFVILTAYDEFDYAHKALELNIDEYLLKPVRPDKIREVVENLIKEIEISRKEEEMKQDIKEKLNMVLPYIKMSFVFDLIFLNIDTIEEIKSRTQFFDIEDMPSAVMIADIDKFARTTSGENEVQRQLMKKEVFSVIKNFGEKYPSLMVVPMSSDKIVILYFGGNIYKNRQIKNWLRQIGEEMCEEVNNKTDFTITIGIGSYYDDPRKVDRSYHEAIAAVKDSLISGVNSTIHWEDIKSKDFADISYPYEIETKLVEKLKSRKTKQIPEIVDTLFKSWCISDDFDFNLSKSRMLELLGVLSRSAVEVGANFKDISPLNYKYTQKLFKVSTPEEMKDWLKSLLLKLSDQIDHFSDDFKDNIIYDGIKFIQSNYEKDITLTEAAEASNLSVHYFSRLFKKEMGITFKEYLTKLRMEDAKRKLKNRDANISRIAKEIGYRNPSYFSKVFKEYEGKSPSEYRNC